MSLWGTPGVPHKGWSCTGMIDLCEDDPEAELKTCEMCGKKDIRYLHIIEHPQCPQIVRSGRVCAEKWDATFVPVNVFRDNYNEVAVDFLKHYEYDQALTTPIPVPIFEIVEKGCT